MPVKEITTHYRIPLRKKNFKILQNAGFDTSSGYVDITFKQMIELGLPVPKDISVECICDYCGKEFSHVGYHITKAIKEHDGKVTCRVCSNMHTCRKKYGRDFYINSDDFKKKSLETFQEHFGEQYTHQSQVPEIKERTKESKKPILLENRIKHNTFAKEIKKKILRLIKDKHIFDVEIKKLTFATDCVEKFKKNQKKFSVKIVWKDIYDTNKYHHHLQIPEIREKIVDTVQEKYGKQYTCAAQVPKIKQKAIDSIKERYGEQYVSTAQVPEVRAKQRQTLYKNGTCAVSKQQKHICDLLRGELNYPFKHFSLDIAFPDEKIYIEYNGGGHNLAVKAFRQMTQEEFDKKEYKRYFTLKNNGWKIICMVAPHDKLLPDQIIVALTEQAKLYLNQNHHSIKIYFEENKITCSQFSCTITEFLNKNF